MKHIFFLLIAAAAFVGCNKDDKGQLDPNAMISLRPEVTKAEGGNPEHLSALEIVKQTSGISFYNRGINGDRPLSRGFVPKQRDYYTPRLLMWGTDIIGQHGELVAEFLDAEDVVFIRYDSDADKIRDTVAYLSNSVLQQARLKIREAYAIQDYATCYSIFDQAYTFIPITGAEWRALKAKGLN